MRDSRSVEVIGHRGAAGLEPENTLRSYRKALELGVDVIECDVRLTRDGRTVLLHDDTVDRTTDGTGRVADLTFGQIRALDAGMGQKVPTLRELLDLAGGEVELHVELKDPAAMESVLEQLADAQLRSSAVLTSGSTDALEQVRAADDAIRLEHIFFDPPADAVKRALRVRAARISSHFTHLTRIFAAESHQNGLELIAWCPNTPADQQRAIAMGVDLVCTDRPDVLLATLRGEPSGGGHMG
jgi:glycerophosphoryl diester phosphodiesterase